MSTDQQPEVPTEQSVEVPTEQSIDSNVNDDTNNVKELTELEHEKVKKFAKYAFVALTGNNPGEDFSAETMIGLQTEVDSIIGEEKTKNILYELISASRDSLLMAYIGMWPPSKEAFDMDSISLSKNIDNLLAKLKVTNDPFTPVYI